MTNKEETPIDAKVSLLWLEAKQVCYGEKSALFPEMTWSQARAIRTMGYEVFKKYYIMQMQGAQDGE
jgi:hypothetical protein